MVRIFGPDPVPNWRAPMHRSSKLETLPKGFTRRTSGVLRVQIRVGGHSELRSFPLLADNATERRRQLAEAEAWASETRRRIVGGSHVSNREAERVALSTVLQRYARDGLTGDIGNVGKDRARIAVILRDPIARKTLAQLRKTDVAALRDRLVEAGFLRNVERKARKLEVEGKASERVAELRSIRDILKSAKHANDEERSALKARAVDIAARADVKHPARTTIANVVQLVSRSLKHAAQTIEGVPDLAGVPMPQGSAGRERRIGGEELHLLLDAAAAADARMNLIIRLAIATTLRRERLLTCRTSHFRDIGGGRRAIVFPKSGSTRKKRTGIVPVTQEIHTIVEEALALQGIDTLDAAADVSLFAISMEAFESRWRRLMASTGIANLHDMRHEGTSRLFERGLTTAEVMSITGHSTQEMVDRYSHYNAALVLDKLERGRDEIAILAEIAFLAAQYRAGGGDQGRLREILDM